MCNNATCKILYSEIAGHRYVEDGPDGVFIELREWTGLGHTDLVLETYTAVDCEESHYATVLPWPYRKPNKAIRYAIEHFDALLAAHPTLGKKDGDN